MLLPNVHGSFGHGEATVCSGSQTGRCGKAAPAKRSLGFAVSFSLHHTPDLLQSQPLKRFELAPTEMFSLKSKAACQISTLGSINHQVVYCRKL